MRKIRKDYKEKNVKKTVRQIKCNASNENDEIMSSFL